MHFKFLDLNITPYFFRQGVFAILKEIMLFFMGAGGDFGIGIYG
jgi:hypothetical protein